MRFVVFLFATLLVVLVALAYNRALTDLNEHDRHVTRALLDTDTPF
jgi:hypothetical protein